MQYAYLLLCTLFLMMAGACLILRPDLLRRALLMGLVGGLAGPAAEVFYLRDYLRPPTLLGTGRISVEDFLFGFAVTVLAFVLYAVACKKTLVRVDVPRRGKLFAVFFVVGWLGMVVCNVWLGINSIIVSSTLLLLMAIAICLLRHDLIKPAIFSALLATAGAIVVYAIVFNRIFPHFWSDYWLLAGKPLGVTILGNIPLTEIMGAFAWASMVSISYPFAHGKAFRDLQAD